MRKHKMLAAALSSALLTACAATTETRTGTAQQVCRSWGTVYPSKKDQLTPGTERQIAGNNAARVPWCGPSAPPPKDEPATVDAAKKRSA
jgi:outer membrane biogenesis lipoprotein LolB